jgi:hypothetical protein
VRWYNELDPSEGRAQNAAMHVSQPILVGSIGIVATLLGVASVRADTIDNPGTIAFTSNIDSHFDTDIENVYFNLNEDELLFGGIDSNGDISLNQGDIFFGTITDDVTWRLEPRSAGTGTYCPNSGEATLTFKARIRITEISSVPLGANPCFVEIDDGNPFTLTTGTSDTTSGQWTRWELRRVRSSFTEPSSIRRI